MCAHLCAHLCAHMCAHRMIDSEWNYKKIFELLSSYIYRMATHEYKSTHLEVRSIESMDELNRFNRARQRPRNPCIIVFEGAFNNIPREAFQGREDIYAVIVAGDITTIGTGAFRGCPNLHTIYFGDNVTHIGVEAVAHCVLLSYIRMPPGLVTENRSFIGCTNLFSLTIPATVEHPIVLDGAHNLHVVINEMPTRYVLHNVPLDDLHNYDAKRVAAEEHGTVKYSFSRQFIYNIGISEDSLFSDGNCYPCLLKRYNELVKMTDRTEEDHKELIEVENILINTTMYSNNDKYMLYYIHCIENLYIYAIIWMMSSHRFNIGRFNEGHIFTLVNFAISVYWLNYSDDIDDGDEQQYYLSDPDADPEANLQHAQKIKNLFNYFIFALMDKLPSRILISFPDIYEHMDLITDAEVSMDSISTHLPVSDITGIVMDYAGIYWHPGASRLLYTLRTRLLPFIEAMDRRTLEGSPINITVDEYRESDENRRKEEQSDIKKWHPTENTLAEEDEQERIAVQDTRSACTLDCKRAPRSHDSDAFDDFENMHDPYDDEGYDQRDNYHGGGDIKNMFIMNKYKYKRM